MHISQADNDYFKCFSVSPMPHDFECDYLVRLLHSLFWTNISMGILKISSLRQTSENFFSQYIFKSLTQTDYGSIKMSFKLNYKNSRSRKSISQEGKLKWRIIERNIIFRFAQFQASTKTVFFLLSAPLYLFYFFSMWL
jgi:hypothetical protein